MKSNTHRTAMMNVAPLLAGESTSTTAITATPIMAASIR
jgi:hypothetical protein